MALDETTAEMARSTDLIDLIKQTFTSRRISAPIAPDGFLRASGLPEVCAREEILCSKLKVFREEEVDADLNLIFLLGTAMHWAVQNHALASVLLGKWQCLDCGAVMSLYEPSNPNLSVAPRPTACTGCKGNTELLYREQFFQDPEVRIQGHPDGFLRLPSCDGVGVLEIKSIGSRGAKDVRFAPSMNHVVQIQIYMWLCNLQWGKILYWEKGVNGLPAFIEHHIPRDEGTIEEIKVLGESVFEGLATGVLPERICNTDICPRAKSCQVRKACFDAAQ